MKNLEIAKIFDQAADLLALLEENTFKILAYRKIARTLEELPSAVEKLAETGELQSVAGIGKSSAERISEYLRTGKIAEFEELLSQVPAGVLQMIKIPSVGPKTAALLWREGGVTTIEDLKTKIEQGAAGGLMNIKGLGEKKLKKIADNLAHLATSSGRIRLGEALPIAQAFVEFLKTLKGVENAQYCGSLRRGKETIGDIDIAVAAQQAVAQSIGDAVCRHTFCATVIQVGESKTSIRTGNGIQIDVRVVPPESWGAALQYFTGSQAHNVKLREIAVKKGLKLNEWGLFRNAPSAAQVKKGKTKDAAAPEQNVASATEEEIYAALGMSFVPPEMREDHGEIEAAQKHFEQEHKSPPSKPIGNRQSAIGNLIELVETAHIRGDLHMHTTASDGSNTIEEMVAEAKRRGYEYVAITDHSKSQFQANGLKSDRLLDHIQKIHAVAAAAIKSNILVLAGSEVDILADGSLDYEDDLLAKLDWVVASPHAALSQESDPATQRLVRAASNPYVCVMGHPTGRIVPSRRGLEPDMAKVIFAAARNGTAMEINANYHRLDLRDAHARMAVEAKVPLCINTDAHSLPEFDMILYGTLTARRAWATRADVLNTKTREQLQQWLAHRKQMAGW